MVSREGQNRPNFNRSMSRPGDFRGNGDRFGGVLCFDQVVSAELFLRFGKWAVRDLWFPVADSDGFCGGSGLQSATAPDGFCELLAESIILLSLRTLLGLVKLGPALLLVLNQQQKFHLWSPYLIDGRLPENRQSVIGF
jgi:hypothetical protein